MNVGHKKISLGLFSRRWI